MIHGAQDNHRMEVIQKQQDNQAIAVIQSMIRQPWGGSAASEQSGAFFMPIILNMIIIISEHDENHCKIIFFV